MPPANSPSESSADPRIATPYFDFTPDNVASAYNHPLSLGPEQEAADRDNIHFLRSALAQIDGEALLETPPSSSRRRELNDNFAHPPNITASERETVRRLRRYVLQGRSTPSPHQDQQHRIRVSRDASRSADYQGWAPGSNDLDSTGELPFTFSDLRALARGYQRRSVDQSAMQVTRDNAPEPGDMTSTGDLERLRRPRFFRPDNLTSHISRTSRPSDPPLREALLQSVRRHARFSPRPTSENDHRRAAAVRDIPSRPMDSSSLLDSGSDSVLSGLTAGELARLESEQSSAAKWLEEAIKYLERLRTCQSTSQRLQSAAAGGFVAGKFFINESRSTDFVLDTTNIPAPPRSSWLRPGSVFSGCQKSTASINPSLLQNTRTSSSRRRPVRNMEADNPLYHLSSHTTDFSTEPGPSPGSWVNRVLLRSNGHEGHVEANNTRNSFAKICPDDSWPVKVTITSVDYDTMRLSGTMEAFNVPNKANPMHQSTIATYLEGEIIDFNQYTLETISFNAKTSVDCTYWRELEPLRSLPNHRLVRSLLSQRWLCEELGEKYILMRWKEKCFITPGDAQNHLTISGFYYVSLRRSDGHLEGLYYDPSSTPYQHLALKPDSQQFPAVQMR